MNKEHFDTVQMRLEWEGECGTLAAPICGKEESRGVRRQILFLLNKEYRIRNKEVDVRKQFLLLLNME